MYVCGEVRPTLFNINYCEENVHGIEAIIPPPPLLNLAIHSEGVDREKNPSYKFIKEEEIR